MSESGFPEHHTLLKQNMVGQVGNTMTTDHIDLNYLQYRHILSTRTMFSNLHKKGQQSRFLRWAATLRWMGLKFVCCCSGFATQINT